MSAMGDVALINDDAQDTDSGAHTEQYFGADSYWENEEQENRQITFGKHCRKSRDQSEQTRRSAHHRNIEPIFALHDHPKVLGQNPPTQDMHQPADHAADEVKLEE